MTIVQCPRCKDEVTVPARASGRALVRCPLCLEEYLLAEALANAPPALVIIGGEVPQAEVVLPAETGEYQLSAATFAPAAPAAMTVSTAARPMSRPIARPRRREKSGLTLVVAYVGGGVLGLALGMLVLWWVIRRDPLNAGPPIAEYVPWIVPAEFRGKIEPAREETAPSSITISRRAASDDPERPAPRSKPTRKSSKQPPQDDLQTLPALDEPATKQVPAPVIDAPQLSPLEPPVSERRSAPDPPRAENGDVARREAGPTRDAPSAPDLRGLLPDDWPVGVPEPPRGRSVVSVAELHDAVMATGETLRNYADLPAAASDARAEAVADFHGAAGEVGRLLSYRELGDSELAEELGGFEKILSEAATKSALVASCELQTAERWAEMPDGYGLLAAGTVKAYAAAGSMFSITLEALGRENKVELSIASQSDPKDVCQIGERMLAAGRVVEQPKVNLPGYEGEQNKVLAAGYLLPLSKSN